MGERLVKHKTTYMVFLGAGASVPLGFPSSVKLVENFVAELRKSSESNKGKIKLVKDFVAWLRRSSEPNERKMLKKIKEFEKTIKSNKFDYDLESLYSCTQGYSDPVKFIRQAGPFACSTCKTQPVLKTKPDLICSRLRSLLEEFLLKTYYNEEPSLKIKIKTVYNRFFSKISGITNWKNSRPDWASSRFEIFTTNFDYVLETYSEQINQHLFKGYRINEKNRVIFTPDEYRKNPAPLKIHKLHGSIELSLLENNEIVSDLPPGIPGKTYGGKNIVSKVMVYGIQKNLIAEPYFDLLAIFKQRLIEIKKCLVVGYSFRDPWINQIFLDVISHDPNAIKIEFIDEKARTIIRKKIPALKKFIIPISQKLEKFLDLPKEGK